MLVGGKFNRKIPASSMKFRFIFVGWLSSLEIVGRLSSSRNITLLWSIFKFSGRCFSPPSSIHSQLIFDSAFRVCKISSSIGNSFFAEPSADLDLKDSPNWPLRVVNWLKFSSDSNFLFTRTWHDTRNSHFLRTKTRWWVRVWLINQLRKLTLDSITTASKCH
jgi:hypothetical protein